MSRRPLALLLFAAVGGAALAAPASTVTCAVAGGHCSHHRLDRGTFSNRNLTHSHWVSASLIHATFKGSDLMGSTFRRANLEFANLSNGDRTRGNYNQADLT